MSVSWKILASVYGPYVAYSVVVMLGGLCAFCYARGQRSILDAAASSAKEAAAHG